MLPKKTIPNKQQLILLDTNIFIYLVDKKRLESILSIIEELQGKFELAISRYTFYEVVRKADKNTADLVDALNLIRQIDVDGQVLGFAALLYSLGIKDDGDSIIAATSVINRSMILTANEKDFSEPIFKEVKTFSIEFKNDNNRTSTQSIHLLENDFDETISKIKDIEFMQLRLENIKKKENKKPKTQRK